MSEAERCDCGRLLPGTDGEGRRCFAKAREHLGDSVTVGMAIECKDLTITRLRAECDRLTAELAASKAMGEAERAVVEASVAERECSLAHHLDPFGGTAHALTEAMDTRRAAVDALLAIRSKGGG